MNQLNSGNLSRVEVVSRFAQSPEFRTANADALEAWGMIEIARANHATANVLTVGLSQQGDDVVLNDNGTTICFESTTINQFDTDMFVFV